MSMVAIRPYITQQMEALSYTEHVDPFNDEIPANIIDNSFHQMLLPVSADERNSSSVGVTVPVQIKKFTKGFRNPEDGLKQSIIDAEAIIAKIITLKNFKTDTEPHITSILLDSLEFAPYSEGSNDNVIVSIFVFNFVVYICTE